MAIVYRTLLIFLALLLAACGGGDAGPIPPIRRRSLSVGSIRPRSVHSCRRLRLDGAGSDVGVDPLERSGRPGGS